MAQIRVGLTDLHKKIKIKIKIVSVCELLQMMAKICQDLKFLIKQKLFSYSYCKCKLSFLHEASQKHFARK